MFSIFKIKRRKGKSPGQKKKLCFGFFLKSFERENAVLLKLKKENGCPSAGIFPGSAGFSTA